MSILSVNEKGCSNLDCLGSVTGMNPLVQKGPLFLTDICIMPV